MYTVTLSEERPESAGDATVIEMGSEPSVNCTLVELGYAEAAAGSPLDVEIQVERTFNDPDQVEQLGETWWLSLSCLALSFFLAFCLSVFHSFFQVSSNEY